MEVDLERWDYALSARDEPFVAKELKKAKTSLYMIGRIEKAMSRIEDGTASPKEFALIESGIYELRVNGEGRWYRLFYGREGDRFIALLLVVKKQNKLERNDITTAKNRLAEHKR